ncbi:MAG TPA: cytochrome b/b6 domain-containing protein [Kofleriaceae bacterium]
MKHPLVIRITHWLAVLLVILMMLTGFEILHAYPHFGPPGDTYFWAFDAPGVLRLGDGVVAARGLHLWFAWFLVGNAVVYLGYLVVRRRTIGFGRLRSPFYLAAFVLGVVEVLSGLVLWKPVSLHRLSAVFGGHEGARLVHFLALIGLVVFLVAHVALTRKRIRDMIRGSR